MHGQRGACNTSGKNSLEAPGPWALGRALPQTLCDRAGLSVSLPLPSEERTYHLQFSRREQRAGLGEVWWKGGRAGGPLSVELRPPDCEAEKVPTKTPSSRPHLAQH